MSHLLGVRSAAWTASAVAAQCKLTEEARQLLGEDQTPAAFVELLLQRELYGDALCFLAQALPPRLAVWWGCECVWLMVRPDPPANEAAALQAAVRWVLDPSEENRRAAQGPGEAEDGETPAGCLALAALWSGGSMLPPELPSVPPPPELTGQLVAGALLLAAVQRDVLAFREHYRQFLALGLELVQDKPFWTEGVCDTAANGWTEGPISDADGEDLCCRDEATSVLAVH